MRPFRGPPRPRNIVMPAQLSHARAQPALPSQPPYMQHQLPPPRAHVQDEEDEEAPVHVTTKSNRPQRTKTQEHRYLCPASRACASFFDPLNKPNLQYSSALSCSRPMTPLPPVTRRSAAWTSLAPNTQNVVCQYRSWTAFSRAIGKGQSRLCYRRNNNRYPLCLSLLISRPTLQVHHHQHW